MEQSMAHFAKLDENNVVLEVIVVSNDDIQNLPFPQSEAVGVAFLNSFLPAATWKQTSYNNNFRFRYADIGSTFHPECGEYGGFADPKPVDNFVWDEPTCNWIPPIPYPTDGIYYYWNYKFSKWSPTIVPSPETTFIG
jgi:hypothetical protein